MLHKFPLHKFSLHKFPRCWLIALGLIGLFLWQKPFSQNASATERAQTVPNPIEKAKLDHNSLGRDDLWLNDLLRQSGQSSQAVQAATQERTMVSNGWWVSTFYFEVDGQLEISISPDVFGPREILPVNPVAPVYDTPNFPAERQLTNHPADDYNPRLSFDGSKVLFVSERDGNQEIYSIESGGSGLTRLTVSESADFSPNWSPDGRDIVFASDRSGLAQIYRMKADGNGVVQLTSGARPHIYPEWSPDGQQLLWVEVIINPLDQSQTRVLQRYDLTTGQVIDLTAPALYLAHPRWSPDGSQIGFDFDANGDFLNDLASISVATGALQIHLTGGYYGNYNGIYAEYWLNSWEPHGGGMIFAQVNYSVVNNKIHSISTFPQLLELDNNNYVSTILNLPFDRRERAYGIDIRPSDIYAPSSSLEPLSTYTYMPNGGLYWGGQDQGPSGIQGYDIQYRSAKSTEWETYLEKTDRTFYEIPYELRGTYYFRSRAVDRAENQEAYPTSPTGEVSTTFYGASLSGQVTDNRHLPLSGTPIEVSAVVNDNAGAWLLNRPVTDIEGEYLLYLTDPVTVAMNTGVNVLGGSSIERNLYMAPADNLLTNGNFESGVSGWTVTNTQVITGIQKIYGGARSIQLKGLCTVLCEETFKIDTTGSIANNLDPVLRVDAADNIDLFLYGHQRWIPGEGWSESFRIEGGARETPPLYDSQGNLHMISDDTHQVRLANGKWQRPTLLPETFSHRGFIGPDDRLHVLSTVECIYGSCEGLIYHTFTLTEGWSSPELLPEAFGDQANTNFDLMMTSDGTIHVVSNESLTHPLNFGVRLRYQSKPVGGVWSQPRPIFYRLGGFHNLDLIDTTDGLKLIAEVGGEQFLLRYAPSGEWPIELPLRAFGATIYMDERGGMHHFNPTDWYISNSPTYRYASSALAWDDLQIIETGLTIWDPDRNGRSIRYGTVSPKGRLYLVAVTGEEELTIWRSPQAVEASRSALTQSVQIPADLHNPTLSFMHRITNMATDSQSRFRVTIDSVLERTTIFTATANTPWQLAWADLSPWAGESVTVTLTLEQAAGDQIVSVSLDEIAIGAWTTPVVESISPAQVAAGEAATITLTGVNFLDMSSVALGDRVLTEVQILDEETLVVTLPADMPAGQYAIRLANSTGPATVSRQAVQVGEALYLPLTSSNQ